MRRRNTRTTQLGRPRVAGGSPARPPGDTGPGGRGVTRLTRHPHRTSQGAGAQRRPRTLEVRGAGDDRTGREASSREAWWERCTRRATAREPARTGTGRARSADGDDLPGPRLPDPPRARQAVGGRSTPTWRARGRRARRRPRELRRRAPPTSTGSAGCARPCTPGASRSVPTPGATRLTARSSGPSARSWSSWGWRSSPARPRLAGRLHGARGPGQRVLLGAAGQALRRAPAAPLGALDRRPVPGHARGARRGDGGRRGRARPGVTSPGRGCPPGPRRSSPRSCSGSRAWRAEAGESAGCRDQPRRSGMVLRPVAFSATTGRLAQW